MPPGVVTSGGAAVADCAAARHGDDWGALGDLPPTASIPCFVPGVMHVHALQKTQSCLPQASTGLMRTPPERPGERNVTSSGDNGEAARSALA